VKKSTEGVKDDGLFLIRDAHKAQNGWRMRRTTPLSAAFSTAAMAGLFLVTGLMGYSLSHGFFEGS
jgi:hypothetical protein